MLWREHACTQACMCAHTRIEAVAELERALVSLKGPGISFSEPARETDKDFGSM